MKAPLPSSLLRCHMKPQLREVRKAHESGGVAEPQTPPTPAEEDKKGIDGWTMEEYVSTLKGKVTVTGNSWHFGGFIGFRQSWRLC